MSAIINFLNNYKSNEYHAVVSFGLLNNNVLKTSIPFDIFSEIKKKITNHKNVFFHQHIESINYFWKNLELVVTPNISYTIQHDFVKYIDLPINNKSINNFRIKLKNDKKIDNIYFPSLNAYDNIVSQNVDTYKYPDDLQTFNQLLIHFYEKKYNDNTFYEISFSSHFDSFHIDDFVKNLNPLIRYYESLNK